MGVKICDIRPHCATPEVWIGLLEAKLMQNPVFLAYFIYKSVQIMMTSLDTEDVDTGVTTIH